MSRCLHNRSKVKLIRRRIAKVRKCGVSYVEIRLLTFKTVHLLDLYNKLKKGYDYRQDAIKLCIVSQADQVKIWKDAREKIRDADSHDIQVDKNFKAEQRKVSLFSFVNLTFTFLTTPSLFQLRLLQAELNIEDILREKSFKMFNERCRTFFKAEKL